MVHQVAGFCLIKVGNIPGYLTHMADPPNPSMIFVAIGMCGRKFVMRNYFIVPVGDVQGSVWTKLYIHRAKPIILGAEKIGKMLRDHSAVGFSYDSDRIDRIRDWIGKKCHVVPFLRKGS